MRVNFEASYGQLTPDSEQIETFEALTPLKGVLKIVLIILSPLPL
jgi:hypothetical protein